MNQENFHLDFSSYKIWQSQNNLISAYTNLKNTLFIINFLIKLKIIDEKFKLTMKSPKCNSF